MRCYSVKRTVPLTAIERNGDLNGIGSFFLSFLNFHEYKKQDEEIIISETGRSQTAKSLIKDKSSQ